MKGVKGREPSPQFEVNTRERAPFHMNENEMAGATKTVSSAPGEFDRCRTSFSVRELIQEIKSYIPENNKQPMPFAWIASGSSILRKIKKYKETLETPRWDAARSLGFAVSGLL